MFLLVSVRHVGAHPGEHQHGVSIQISITLGKTFLRISRIRNIPLTWILARVFLYVPPFISRILDFIYWTVLNFILIFFEWRDTENQQFCNWLNINYSVKTCRCFYLIILHKMLKFQTIRHDTEDSQLCQNKIAGELLCKLSYIYKAVIKWYFPLKLQPTFFRLFQSFPLLSYNQFS